MLGLLTEGLPREHSVCFQEVGGYCRSRVIVDIMCQSMTRGISSALSLLTVNNPTVATHRPTVWLEVISLVASSCGYNRGEIELRVAHQFPAHVATQRGRAECPQHRHPSRAQPVTPMRECHGGRPWLTPEKLHRSGTTLRAGTP